MSTRTRRCCGGLRACLEGELHRPIDRRGAADHRAFPLAERHLRRYDHRRVHRCGATAASAARRGTMRTRYNTHERIRTARAQNTRARAHDIAWADTARCTSLPGSPEERRCNSAGPFVAERNAAHSSVGCYGHASAPHARITGAQPTACRAAVGHAERCAPRFRWDEGNINWPFASFRYLRRVPARCGALRRYL